MSADLLDWSNDRAADGSSFLGINQAVFAAGIRHALTLLADPNTPDVDAVLQSIDSRRKAILRKLAGEVGI